jgi:hypothetical protein
MEICCIFMACFLDQSLLPLHSGLHGGESPGRGVALLSNPGPSGGRPAAVDAPGRTPPDEQGTSASTEAHRHTGTEPVSSAHGWQGRHRPWRWIPASMPE